MTSPSALPIPEGTGRRRYPRYQLTLPFDVTVFRPSSVVNLSGSTHCIGEGGLSGVISGAMLPGERAELTILLPTAAEPLSMHAVVRHQADLYCGFEFLNLEHGQLEQLQCLATDPALSTRLINETEWEPGMAPPPHGGVALCDVCGQELPEEIPVCLTCGTPQSPEAMQESDGRESPLAPEPALAAAQVGPAARKEPVTRRGPVLDSVVSIIFVVTLAIGLLQWLQSPVDANAQPSVVTVELENAFLRPPSVTEASRTERSSASGAFTAAKSVVSAVIGGASADDQQVVGAPGSAAAERSRPRQQVAVSNSSAGSPSPASAPASASQASSPSLSSSAMNALTGTSSGGSLPAQSSSAGQSSLPAPSSSPVESNAASAAASQEPSGSDLAGMLLQKVLPVYPAAARRQGVQGQVVLKAVIGKDGTIAALRPLQGPQQLTAAAMDAVQHWRFRPYELKGKPVEVETDIRLNFQLPGKR
ncbi:MAG TPA: TonB family protein [Terriglobales bacterium]|nr:TonB family protein [Terriglobales bacterium]